MGYAVITPHLNSGFGLVGLMEHGDKKTDWLTGDLEILAACDGIVMLPNWQESMGAIVEHNEAKSYEDMKIFYWDTDVDELKKWAKEE